MVTMDKSMATLVSTLALLCITLESSILDNECIIRIKFALGHCSNKYITKPDLQKSVKLSNLFTQGTPKHGIVHVCISQQQSISPTYKITYKLLVLTPYASA